MKRLSDEMVAKALGWRSLEPKDKKQSGHYWCSSRGLDGTQVIGPPPFTTSLDAIVAGCDDCGEHRQRSIYNDGYDKGWQLGYERGRKRGREEAPSNDPDELFGRYKKGFEDGQRYCK